MLMISCFGNQMLDFCIMAYSLIQKPFGNWKSCSADTLLGSYELFNFCVVCFHGVLITVHVHDDVTSTADEMSSI